MYFDVIAVLLELQRDGIQYVNKLRNFLKT